MRGGQVITRTVLMQLRVNLLFFNQLLQLTLKRLFDFANILTNYVNWLTVLVKRL